MNAVCDDSSATRKNGLKTRKRKSGLPIMRNCNVAMNSCDGFEYWVVVAMSSKI